MAHPDTERGECVLLPCREQQIRDPGTLNNGLPYICGSDGRGFQGMYLRGGFAHLHRDEQVRGHERTHSKVHDAHKSLLFTSNGENCHEEHSYYQAS